MNNSSLFRILVFSVIFILNTMQANSQTKYQLKKITQELEQAYALDQESRDKLNEVQRTNGYGSEEYSKKLKEMNSQDSINRDIVFKIIDQYGWINKASSSENASKAIFYVIQHSDLKSQLKYKELVQQAFADLEISNIEYVLFEDRLKVRQGKYQLYGTQNAIDNIGNSYLYPVENVDSVNIRRSKIGLQKLSEQLTDTQTEYAFPTESDPQYEITLIGHFWEGINIGIGNVSVWHDNKYIGKTNSNGFFFVKYSFFRNDTIKLTIKNGENIVGRIPITKGRDFYEISIKLEPKTNL